MPVEALDRCISDMKETVGERLFGLDFQVRAYDLLDCLMAVDDADSLWQNQQMKDVSGRFCKSYVELRDELKALYDGNVLMGEAEEVLVPVRDAMNEARFAAASAASLHEYAKEVFDIWQTSGIFARRRALRELRERAGFRLESHRIGNYVAKTFDLMNEAQAKFAKAQQAVFAADVKYKIRPDTYADIYALLSRRMP